MKAQEGDIVRGPDGIKYTVENGELKPIIALHPETQQPVTDYQTLFQNQQPLSLLQNLIGGASAVAEGGTLGFTDEATRPFAPEEGVAGVQAIRERFAEENPKTNLGLEMAGVIANPLTRRFGAKMVAARPFLGGATTGGVIGGITGAGKNEEDRLGGALTGTALGAGFGGPLSYLGALATQKAAPLAQQGIQKLRGLFRPTISTAQQQADDILRPAFQRGFENVDEALAQSRRIGQQGTLMDMSPEMAGMSSAAFNREIGGIKSKALKLFANRSREGMNRVAAKLNKVFGNKGKSLTEAYKQTMRGNTKEVTQLFDDARSQIIPEENVAAYAQYLDDQIRLTENTSYSRAFKAAKKALMSGTGKEAKLKTNVEQLDLARRNLADRASEAFRQGRMDEWRILKNARNQFDDMMPESYRLGWQKASEGKQIINAAEAGEKFFLPSNKTEDFLEWVASASDAEKKAYTMSMLKAAKEKMGNVTEGGKITRFFNSPNVREKLTALIGDPKRAGQFIDDIERENLFKATQNLVTGNSFTAARQEAGKLLDDALGLAQVNTPTSRGEFLNALGKRMIEAVKLETSLKQEVKNALVDRLTKQGVTPETVRMLMSTPAKEVFKQQMIDLSPKVAQGIAAEAGFLAGQ